MVLSQVGINTLDRTSARDIAQFLSERTINRRYFSASVDLPPNIMAVYDHVTIYILLQDKPSHSKTYLSDKKL